MFILTKSIEVEILARAREMKKNKLTEAPAELSGGIFKQAFVSFHQLPKMIGVVDLDGEQVFLGTK